MKIMLCNDDGVFAPGIRVLASHLKAAGHELTIVAPDRERSAASHSITLRRDLRMKELQPNEYSVDGTPVDCVVLATQKILSNAPDLVISGINAGQNMGRRLDGETLGTGGGRPHSRARHPEHQFSQHYP